MKSYYWIKLYHEILDDAKMGRLPDRLWRRAIELFLMAGEEHDGGNLPSLADMAWRLRLDDDVLLNDLQELAQVNIVTQRDDGSWFVTNFAERQGAMGDAERQRRYRERQHRTQYYGNDTRDETVTKCNTDVDIDVDKDIDKDVDIEENAFHLYEQATASPLTRILADRIDDLINEYEEHRQSLPPPAKGSDVDGDGWVRAAIDEAVGAANNGRINFNFVAAILDRWKRDGFQAPFKPSKGKQAKNKEVLDEWLAERTG